MVRALAGLSTMTRCFPAADNIAPPPALVFLEAFFAVAFFAVAFFAVAFFAVAFFAVAFFAVAFFLVAFFLVAFFLVTFFLVTFFLAPPFAGALAFDLLDWVKVTFVLPSLQGAHCARLVAADSI